MSRLVLDSLVKEDADVIAIQETKLSYSGLSKKHIEKLAEYFPEYAYVYRQSEDPAKKSYAGTMTLYKKNLISEVSFPQIGAPSTMDFEGRIITLEFNDFYFTHVYTPNAGNGLNRLVDRQVWDKLYADYLEKLDQNKPVIAAGDFNVAHKEIDLAHPENNHMSPGFTDEEREGFTNLLNRGFTDTYRYIHGDVEGKYTWWAQRVKTSKINNSGWRIDYFLVSDRIKELITSSDIIDSGDRQDHTPIVLEINI